MNQRRWPNQLAHYPYAQSFLRDWQIDDHSQDSNWLEYEQALETYLASQDEDLSLGERYECLLKSRDQFQSLAAKGDAHIGTSLALIRLNLELDDRQAAINAMSKMLHLMPWLQESLPETLKLKINRPFLAPVSDFDYKLVDISFEQWLQLSILSVVRDLNTE